MLQPPFQMVTFSGYSIARFFLFFVYLFLLMAPGFVYAVDTDDDDDGMPDTFEIAFGLDSLMPADSAVDSDSDGHDNLSEFRAGTSPIDNNQHPGRYRQVKLRVAAYPREFIYYNAAAHFQDTKARIRSIR